MVSSLLLQTACAKFPVDSKALRLKERNPLARSRRFWLQFSKSLARRPQRSQRGRQSNTWKLFLLELSVDNSFNSILQMRLAEVDEQSELESAQSQLGQKLFGMYSGQRFERFKLDDNFSIHHQVRPKRFIESDAIVNDGHRFLSLDC